MDPAPKDPLARICDSLAHDRRVHIFRILHSRPETGRSFAHLADATGLAPSSLVHHLRAMERYGLIFRRTKGASTEYCLRLDPLKSVFADLLRTCSGNIGGVKSAA